MAKLKVKMGSTELMESDIYHFECAYRINEIPYLELTIRDGDIVSENFARANHKDFAPGTDVTLYGGVEAAKNHLFAGIITQSYVSIIEGKTALTVTAKGEAVKLAEHPVNFMSNKEIDDETIIKKVANLSGTYVFNDLSPIAKNKIKHSQFAVFQQTPWRIIFARMLENGAVFRPSLDGDDLVNLAELTPIDKGTPFALHEVKACSMHVDTESVIDKISTNAWDVKKQTFIEVKASSSSAFKEWDDAEKVLARKSLSLSMTAPLTKPQLQAIAQAETNFRLLDQCQGQMTVTQNSIDKVAELSLLNIIKMKGVGEKFAEDNLITGICHRFSAGDGGWQIDIEFGLPLAKTLYNDASRVPEMQSTMGKVAAFKSHAQLPNTLPVIIPAIDPINPLYARLLTPFASKEEGFFFQPAKDDEVMVTFLGGNASYPMIVGSCHNNINTPPMPYDAERLQKGIFSFVDGVKMFLRFDAKNKIFAVGDDDNTLEITPDGTVSLLAEKAMTFTTKDTLNVSTTKNVEIAAGGDVNVSATKNVEISASTTEIK